MCCIFIYNKCSDSVAKVIKNYLYIVIGTFLQTTNTIVYYPDVKLLQLSKYLRINKKVIIATTF